MNGQSDDKKKQKTRVKVAIRVRPMIPKQIANNQNLCVEFHSNDSIILGSDKNFKFDHVFKDTCHQSEVYNSCVKDLVMSCFQGYNAAILAYGQTGSGKTYTMGTATHTLGNQNQTGIVPRVITEIFSVIEQKKNKIQFRVKASFLEIYNEEIKDLLVNDHNMKTVKQFFISKRHKDTGISIRQEKDGSVSIYGLTEQQSTSAEQMIGLLERGGCNRTTAATLMNDASSRSHAIFTIFIEQHIIEDLYKSQKGSVVQNTEGYMTAKFFFVDLAGSERAKKTGATGATLKEGININLGLLELGNVISALSTIQKKDQFITYRNSKLTRILQDCLGGNSNTYMIACVSPAESNFEESLNTLKYASKAMNIKNKPVVNRDPQSALISQLKQKIFQLQVENRKLKQIMSKGGNSLPGGMQGLDLSSFSGGQDQVEQQLNEMKRQISQLQKKCETYQIENQQFRKKTNELEIKNYDLRRKNDRYQLLIEQVQNQNPELNIKKKFQTQESDEEMDNEGKNRGKSLLEQYQLQIQNLEAQLEDKDKLFKQLEKELERMEKNSKNDEQILIKKNKQIYQLSKEISNLQKLMRDLSQTNTSQSKEASKIKTQSALQTSRMQDQTMQTFQNQDPSQQLQDEFLQNDKELLTQQQSLQKMEEQASNQLLQIQKYIKEKQTYLQQMTKKQINMEYELISEMKEEYHQKISILQKEKKLLLKQKDQTLGNNEKTKFVTKIDTLETELKDYRKKVKQQKNIEKQLSLQTSQIKQLADQIKKSKLQKLQLNRKLKQDKDNFNKLKNQRIKELLNAKKETLKKQNALRKAQLENQKKTIQFRKKDEEVKRVKRVNQTLKTLLKQPTVTELKGSTMIQKKQMPKKQSNVPMSADMIKASNFAQHQMHQIMTQSQSNDLVRSILTKMTRQIDHQRTQTKYTQKGRSLEQELEILLNDEATFKLKYEKINLVAKQQRTEEQLTMMSELQINLADIHERVLNLEDSINFIREKEMQIVNEHVNYFDPQNQVIYNRQLTQAVQNVRLFYKSIFWAIKSLLTDNFVLIETREQNESEIGNLHQQIEELRENMIKLNHQHQINLSKLRQEMILRSYQNSYPSMEGEDLPPGTVSKKLQEKEKKSFERKILDLTKSNRQLSQQVEMWKRKCSVVQDKYQNIRNLMSKDKNIGRQPLNQKQESKQKKMTKNQIIIDDINQMLTEIDKMKKTSCVIQDTDKQKVEHIEDTLDYSINKWECLGKIDAHNSAILSMTAHANILISTGTKSLKIWDLQTSKIISDLSGPHLGGFVKYVMVDPERRLMFTACQKNITIWDLVTLNIEGTLKGHKDEVRTMHINNDLLFTGGKGLANSGSLLVWDLRNLNPNHPMEDKERNQDIFSFASKNNILYYGTRNHHVRRMNMTNMEILSPFEPPHMDSVTGLAIVKDKLISGSKDKNLRLWSLDHSINNSKHTFPAFNDYITLCQSDKELPIFYTGSRDGQIKVGGIKNDKIELIGGIMAHTQSVNAICPLEENENIIVTASADKTIKLWKPTHQTVESIQNQFI